MARPKSRKATGYLPSPNDAGIRPCPFDRDEFHKRARQVKVTLEYAGQTIELFLVPDDFKTGSYGFRNQGHDQKVQFDMDGAPAIFQCNLLLTLVGSGKMDAWVEWDRQKREQEDKA